MRYDVFLSYAHFDEAFKDRLKTEIETTGPTHIGREIRVWDDYQIPAGADWESHLLHKLWLSRILVPVISPSWLKSRFSDTEWNEKWNDLEGDFFSSSQTSILPVTFQMDERARRELPDRFTRLQYAKAGFSDPMETDKFKVAAAPFLQDLAQRLGDLDTLEEPPRPIRGKVFLGMVFSQQAHRFRRQVKQQLRGRYFDVIEFNWWDNWTPQEITSKCTEDMRDCLAAVHFLDSSPGLGKPADVQPPFPVDFQISAGRDRSQANNPFYECFYAGDQRELEKQGKSLDDEVASLSYWKFLEPLLDSAKTNTDPVNTFCKNVLLVELEKMIHPEIPKPPSQNPSACLVFDYNDREVADRVRSYLVGRNWDLVPAAAEEFVNRNTFLFYWGKSKRNFVESNFSDLATRRAVNELKQPPATALYLGADYQPNKDKVKKNNDLCPNAWGCVVDGNFTDFDPSNPPAAFSQFVQSAEASAKNDFLRANAGVR